MKNTIIVSSILFTNVMISQQQQLGNLFIENNANPSVQFSQTNMNNNNGNLNDDSNMDNQSIQQLNSMDNVGNYSQIEQNDNSEKETNKSVTGNGTDFSSLNGSSRSFSSSGSSSKSHKHTFNKKLSKFQRNFYGKMTSHKKSKHLVDVCFNWSK